MVSLEAPGTDDPSPGAVVFSIFTPASGGPPILSDPQFFDPAGNPALEINPQPGSAQPLLALLASGSNDPYSYFNSLLNGDDLISLPGNSTGILEVGAGGTATIDGGANAQIFIWHDKTVNWTTSGSGNTLLFFPERGEVPFNSGLLMLDLMAGTGINPFGGTLTFQGVDQVAAGYAGGEYVVCNNAGDTINSSIDGAFDFAGNALIVGGSGNDTLHGSNIGTFSTSTVNVLVAGSGADTLSGGVNSFVNDPRTETNFFSYNLGVDIITNFRAGTNTGDAIDLSDVPGISSFSDLQSKMAQVGDDTVITFAASETITLDNVTESALTASNFLFAPEAAFAFTEPGEADTSDIIKIYLAITGAVTVDTTDGAPTLTLSDGAIATYDAAASAASNVLVFDYTVGSSDHSANLAIDSVNVGGAVIAGAHGQSVNFAPVQGQSLGVEINSSPLYVASVTTSASQVDPGDPLTITLNMSESDFTVDTTNGTPALTLSNGKTARFASQNGDQLNFSYTPSQGDDTLNLAITGEENNVLFPGDPGAVIQDSNGYAANFSAVTNYQTGVQIGPALYASSITTDATPNTNIVGYQADAGSTLHLTLNMSQAVTVTGSPMLSLSDGASASYDSALSDPSSGALVFDYTVGSTDHSPDLTAAGVSGGTIDAASDSSISADFSNLAQLATGVQIGPSPLTVTSLSASASGHVADGETVLITLQMSEAITLNGNNPGVQLNDGEEAFYDASDSNLASGKLVFEYFAGAEISDAAASNLTITGIDLGQSAFDDLILGADNDGATQSIQDASGYNADFSNALNVPLGVQVGDPLYVSSIGTTWASPEADAGNTVVMFVNLSEGVTVNTANGSPTLTLNDGATAAYDVGASNLAAGQIAFDYQVGANDSTAFLTVTAINPNGALIQDGSSNAAQLTLPQTGLQVDSDNSTVPLQIGPAVVSSINTSELGEVTTGQQLLIEINFDDSFVLNTGNGSPTLTLSDGATATLDPTLNDAAAAAVGSLIFDYTPAVGDNSANLEIDNVNLNNATVEDTLNGSNVNFAGALDVPLNVQIATGTSTPPTLPVISAIGEHPGTGDLGVGNSGTFALTTNENVTVTGTPTLSLNDGGIATYDATESTGTELAFDYSVASSDSNVASLAATALNVPAGVAIIDGNGNNLDTSLAGLTQNGPEISVTSSQTPPGPPSYPQNPGNNDEWILSNGSWEASAGPGSHPSGYSVAAVGDWTGDGTDGILWFDPTTGDTDEWQLSNTQWAGSVDLGSHPGNYQIAGVGDFTDDGIGDVLWTSTLSTGQVQTDIWELSSDGQWMASASPGNHPAGYQVAGIGDWTGDGTDGVLWYNSGTGDVDEWQLDNGQWAASVDLGVHPGNYQIAGVGDFFGSGIDDVLWTGVNSDGTVSTDIWELGSTGQWIASVSPGSHPAGYQVVAIGDFTGNGTSDILWQNPTTGDVDEWLINNGQWAGSIDLGTHPGNFQIAGTGSFTGSTTQDILWHSNS